MSAVMSNIPISKDEADILAIAESMLKANHNKDAAAFAAPFAPDATIYNLAPPSCAQQPRTHLPRTSAILFGSNRIWI
jgi:hypothetical protein